MQSQLQRELNKATNFAGKRNAYLNDYKRFISHQERVKTKNTPSVRSVLKRSGFVKHKDRFHAVVKDNKADPSMKRVCLTEEDLGDSKCALLAQAICADDCPMRQLFLSSNRLNPSGFTALLDAFRLNFSIVNLSVQSNNLGDDQAAQLCEVLSSNSSITSLSLGHNRISDAGLAHFAALLLGPARRNNSLVELDLFGNQITDAGASTLAHALVQHTTVDLCARTGRKLKGSNDSAAQITSSSCLDRQTYPPKGACAVTGEPRAQQSHVPWQWTSGPVGPHWVELDLGEDTQNWSSVCGYSFQSQGDYWGPDGRHIANDGPTEYMLQASSDRINWQVLHYQNCGQSWGEMQHVSLSLEQQLLQQQLEQEKLLRLQQKKEKLQQYSGPPLGTGAFHHGQVVSQYDLAWSLQSFLSAPEVGSSIQDVRDSSELVGEWKVGGLALGALGVGFGDYEGEERRHTVCWDESSRIGQNSEGKGSPSEHMLRRRKCCIEFTNGDQKEPLWRYIRLVLRNCPGRSRTEKNVTIRNWRVWACGNPQASLDYVSMSRLSSEDRASASGQDQDRIIPPACYLDADPDLEPSQLRTIRLEGNRIRSAGAEMLRRATGPLISVLVHDNPFDAEARRVEEANNEQRRFRLQQKSEKEERLFMEAKQAGDEGEQKELTPAQKRAFRQSHVEKVGQDYCQQQLSELGFATRTDEHTEHHSDTLISAIEGAKLEAHRVIAGWGFASKRTNYKEAFDEVAEAMEQAKLARMGHSQSLDSLMTETAASNEYDGSYNGTDDAAWIEQGDEYGNVYYFNTETQETSWDPPQYYT